ncbi:MAG: hypothetical protein EG828_16305 [Deltaproteobacteria bacterium]|nr:hypothetical protein [Deltaproteobacteria bacterium]
MTQAVIEVLREEIREIKPILFNGDNYTKEWEKEAAKRGLPNNKTTPTALKALITEEALDVFEKYQVLSRVELSSRYNIYLERYIKDFEIEAKCLSNICQSQIIPAGTAYQRMLASTIVATKDALGTDADVTAQKELLLKVLDLVNNIHSLNKRIQSGLKKTCGVHDEVKKADMLSKEIKPEMDELRSYVDTLETLVEDEMWPLPKFWEMLFIS